MKNADQSPKALSAAALQCAQDHFQDACSSNLDWLMSDSGAGLESVVSGCCEAHLLAAHQYPELAAASPAALKGISIAVDDVLQGDETYSKEEVLAKFRETGFNTEGEKIFYDNPRIGAEKPASAPAEKPSKAEELQSYLQLWFAGQVMAAENFRSFKDALADFNVQNAYNVRDYKPETIALSDLKNLSVSAIFNGDEEISRQYGFAEFAARLEDLGFRVKGDTLLGHKTVLTAGKGVAGPKI